MARINPINESGDYIHMYEVVSQRNAMQCDATQRNAVLLSIGRIHKGGLANIISTNRVSISWRGYG